MIRLTQKEFEDFKRHKNPEVFTETQMSNWIEDVKETLIKAEVDDLNDIEKSEVEKFRSELKSFIKVEVVRKHEDPLVKGLVYETFYTRPQQIIWDADEIVKSEDGKEEIIKSRSGIYADTSQNRKMGRVGQRFGGKKEEIKEPEKDENKKMSDDEKINIWNKLSDQEKAAMGDQYITHESDLRAWVKPFNELSELKRKRVLQSIENFSKVKDHKVRGYGIKSK